MSASTPNLFKRGNGRFYVRLYVPSDLIDRFQWSEITKGLGTKRRDEAERIATFIRYSWIRLMDSVRRDASLTSPDLKRLARSYFDSCLAQAEADRLKRKLRRGECEHIVTQHVENRDRLKDWLARNRLSQVRENVAEILADTGLSADQDSDEFRTLAHYCLRGLAEVETAMIDRWFGQFDTKPSDPLFATPEARQGERGDVGASEPLGTLIETFQDDHKVVWKPRTREKYRANLSLCAEIIGDRELVATIDKRTVRRLKERLSELPSNWPKLYPGKQIGEVPAASAEAGAKPLSAGSVNAYLGTLSSFFSWAMREGFAQINPVSGIRAIDPVRPEDKRNPYTGTQLETIFSAPLYRGMRSDRHWQKPGNVVRRDARYWLPLVALFTGMRLGELLALQRQDIQETEGVYHIRIRAAKTRAGVRRIPVHPELARLRFREYVEGHEGPETILLPGYTQRAFSKFYRRFQDSIGLTDSKLVFHSFRHTFADALRAASIDQSIAKALLGHADGTVTGQYGSGYPIQVLENEMEKITFPCVNELK